MSEETVIEELEPMEVEEEKRDLSPREEAIEAIVARRAAEDSGTIVDAHGAEIDDGLSEEAYDDLDPELQPPTEPDSCFLSKRLF